MAADSTSGIIEVYIFTFQWLSFELHCSALQIEAQRSIRAKIIPHKSNRYLTAANNVPPLALQRAQGLIWAEIIQHK